MDHDAWIDRIGEHIREAIEPGRAMSWQTKLDARDNAQTSRDWGRNGYVLAYWCIFAVPSVFALVGLGEDASGFLQWATVGAGVVLTLINTAEWLVRVGWRRSRDPR